jgi:hypothetical protein
MKQELYMLLIRMLGDDLGSSDNDVQALLQPMDVRSQADEMLEVRITQDAIGSASSDKSGYAMLGNLFQRGIPSFAKLLERTPDWSRNQSQGDRARKRSGHWDETSTQRIAQFQRKANDLVVVPLGATAGSPSQ